MAADRAPGANYARAGCVPTLDDPTGHAGRAHCLSPTARRGDRATRWRADRHAGSHAYGYQAARLSSAHDADHPAARGLPERHTHAVIFPQPAIETGLFRRDMPR